jgi:type-F conjugative transfer system pilin assembly protein TrbC
LPDVTLRQYSKQAAEYGAVLVLRGLYKNSLEETKLRAFGVNPSGVEWNIAPAAFKKFKVNHVPVIILADAATESALDNGCAKEGDFLRVDGDISMHQALVIMKQEGTGRLVKTAENLLETENQ